MSRDEGVDRVEVNIKLGLILGYMLSGCGGEVTETSTTTTVTTGTTSTTSTTAETSTTTETSTTSTGTTTTKPEGWIGWEVVDSDTEGYGLYGYVLETWEINEKAENYFQTNLGTDRKFYLLRPQDTPADAVNLLMTLHGGTVDDDSAKNYYTGPDPFETKCGLAEEVSIGFAAFRHLQTHEVMSRGWAQVLPVNLWCDFWMGRGKEDPVDPENHKAYVHVSEVLDFLTTGAAGFDVADLYMWGSSSGGAATIPLAHWYEGVDGVVSDSPPCKMDEYYNDDMSSLTHMFGGRPFDGKKPSKFYQNYLDVSCDWLVSSGGYDVPTFMAYNVRDALTRSYSPEAFAAAADATFPSAGVRYGYHDFDHNSPGLTFHTQTRASDTISQYTTSSMFSFLEGATVHWIEAEAGCSIWACDVGTVLDEKTSPMDQSLKNASQNAAIGIEQSEGAGIAYTGRVPAMFEEGETVTAVVVMQVDGINGTQPDTDVLVTISYMNASGVIASKEVTVGDVVTDVFSVGDTVEGTQERHQRQIHQYASSSLELTIEDQMGTWLSVQYSGLGGPSASVYIDAIQYVQ